MTDQPPRNRDPATLPDTDFQRLPFADLRGWQMAGQGYFTVTGDGWLESVGGPGLLWYADQGWADFVLRLDWRTRSITDNSGVFLRIPPLTDSDRPAIEHGYEVQIDDRGVAPDGSLDSPLHLTGAIYTLAPAAGVRARPPGSWNDFQIVARGPSIAVWLNGQPVSRLERGDRRLEGHIALQAHHDGSAVQFRDIRILPL